jgi:hypothetical protein
MNRHVDAIPAFPLLAEVKQLQQFLGLINFYPQCLPGITEILRHLTDSLNGDSKNLLAELGTTSN